MLLAASMTPALVAPATAKLMSDFWLISAEGVFLAGSRIGEGAGVASRAH